MYIFFVCMYVCMYVDIDQYVNRAGRSTGLHVLIPTIADSGISTHIYYILVPALS